MKWLFFSLCISFFSIIASAQTWISFGLGIPNSEYNQPTVCAIIEYHDTLYAGGNITTAGGMTMNTGLAFWNGYDWFNGNLSEGVTGLNIFNDTLYAIGGFGIKKYVNNSWVDLGTGLNAGATSMCMYNNDLYVAGGFTQAGGVTVYGIAKWDGAQWYAVGAVSGNINSLAVYNNLLYAFGGFTQVNGNLDVKGGAAWDTTTAMWNAIPNLPLSGFGGNPNIGPVIVYHDTLYLGADNMLYQYVNDTSSLFFTTNQYSPDAVILSPTILFDKMYFSLEAPSGGDFTNIPLVYDGNTIQSVPGGGYYFGEFNCQLVSSGMNTGSANYFARLWNTPTVGFVANKITACQGDTIVFSDTVCQGGPSRLWQFSGGTPSSSTLENPTVVYTEPGSYSVSLTITNPAGSDSATVSNYITVTATPASPTVSNNGPLCPAGDLQLTASTIADASYDWTGPDTFNIQNPSLNDVAITDSGIYTVVVTVGGCSSVPVTTDVVINPTPIAPSVSNSGPLCPGDTLIFSAGAVAGAVYAWTGPENLSGQNPSINGVNPADSGAYSLTITVAGCQSNAATTNAVIYNPPPAPVISSNDTLICYSDSTQICVQGTYPTYQWSNGYTSGCIYASSAGRYYMTVTDAEGCSATSNVVNIAALPVPDVSISQVGDTLIAHDAQAYQWYFNGNIIANATFSIYVATRTGLYTVQVTDSSGCTALSSAIEITVGINSVTGITGFAIYPNPVTDKLQIQFSIAASAEIHIQIIDVTGRIVYNAPFNAIANADRIELNTGNMSSGTYLLKIGNIIRKFVKE